MTDQEFDRLLAAAMQVEHSPEFLPRVRRRVEIQQSVAWSQWLSVTAIATVSAAALVAAILAWPARPHRLPASQPAMASRATAAPVVTPPNVSVAVARRKPTFRQARTEQSPPAATSPVPEVLIPPEEVGGFRLLVAAAQEGWLPTELPSDERRKRAEPLLPPIDIPPVSIERISTTTPFEGERP